jgi:hypothetical protein
MNRETERFGSGYYNAPAFAGGEIMRWGQQKM